MPQVNRPEIKRPQPMPTPSVKEKQVPIPPAPPYKTVWTVTLAPASRVTLSAGTANLFVGMDAGPIVAYALGDAKQVWTANLKSDVDLTAGDDVVFVPQGDTVHALDQATGNERWAAKTGALATTPTWRPGWLFTASKDGVIAAWRVSDGSQVWQRAVGSPASAPMAVDGDALFVPLADKRLLSLRILEGGEPNWTLTLGGVGGQPLAAAGRVYLGTSEYQFYSIKQDHGDLDWPLGHRLIRSTVVGHPVLDERHIYVATNDNRLLALSRGNGEIDWMPTLTSRPAPQLVVDNGQVIVPLISGDLAVFNQKDGKVVTASLAAPASPSPTAAPGGTSPGGTAAPALPTTPAASTAPASAQGNPEATPASQPPPPTTPSAAPQASPPRTPAGPGLGPGATVVAGTPRGSEGIRLAAPLVLAGGPDAPQLLRVTLGADTVHTVTAFRREKTDKPVPPAKQ